MKMIRKVIGTLLLITAILITQIPVTYTSASSSSDFQMDGTTLVKYAGTSSAVSIPDNVKVIGREAFAGNINLTEVKIGKNVKTIEQGAFRDCTYLSKVTLPESLLMIGNGAFANNVSLKTLHLPVNLSEIGSGVFAGCKSLYSLTIDKNNSNFIIDKNALYDDKKEVLISYLEGVKDSTFLMPNSVKKIDEYAFWGNENLSEIALSNNLEEISDYAFSNCKNISSITIPYSVKYINAKAFENCINLGFVDIPVSVGYIHETAFDGCPKLVIKAEENSTAYKYYESWKLRNQSVPGSNTISGNTLINEEGKVYVVGSDGQLVEVKNDTTAVSSSTSSGSSSAMHDPSNVDYVPAYDPLRTEEDGILAKTMVVGQNAIILMDPKNQPVNNLSQRTVTAEEESTAESTVLSNEKGDALPKYAIVDDRITSYAYYNDKELTSYTIPSNINSIGDFAFARTGLTSINIPNGVKTIGYAAFYHCDQLTEITIPSTVTWIEPSAFSYSGWLTNWANNPEADNFLIVGDGILMAYKGSDSYVNIPEGVETIAPGCFIGHTEITGVNIPDSVTIIGEEAFKDCSNLTAVHGGNYVKKIKDRAFYGTALLEVAVGEYVEEIGLGAFAGMSDANRKVVFKGSSLPKLSYSDSSMVLGSENAKMAAFPGKWTAVIKNQNLSLEDTVLEDTGLGVIGTIVTEGPGGNFVTVASRGVKASSANSVKISSGIEGWEAGNVQVETGKGGEFQLNLSSVNKEEILPSFQRIYGKILPEMAAFDMTLTDSTGTLSYKKFTETPLKVTLPVPSSIAGSVIHAAAIDEDGQLEKLSSSITEDETGRKITFTTNHLSSFVIYAFGEDGQLQVDSELLNTMTLKKDDTPNTGDYSIHPKWFAALLVASVSVGFFAYRPKGKHAQRNR